MANSQSQCILSSKGPLGTVYIAGYFFNRLKKHQITSTCIPSSVDKIMLEGLPSVTYRILAYLLLGVVRIYSKKVDYLCQDCRNAVSDVNRMSVGKEAVPFRDTVRPTPSIILPERFELDSFPLEVADGPSRSNIGRSKDICLKGDAGKYVFSQYSLDKQLFEEVSTLLEDLLDPQTSHGDIRQQETCSLSQTPNKVTMEQEVSTFAHTPPRRVLSPHHVEIDVGVSSPNYVKDLRSKEKLRELRFTGEDGIDVDRFCELDVELINLINNYQVQTIDDLDEDVIKKAPLDNNEESLIEKDNEEPNLIEKTHVPEVDVRVEITPDLMIVPTPGKKENIPARKVDTRRPGKRKCIFDETTVLSNEIMKQGLKDASSLVCKKRKAPYTVIDLWRIRCIPSLSSNFSAPLIPCAALDLDYVPCGKKARRTELSSRLAVEIIETEIAPPTNQFDTATLSAPADSRPTIAPGTPVRCSASARVFGSARAEDSDGEGSHSYENDRMDFFVNEEGIPGPSLMDEMDANEADSRELQKNKKGRMSARTRTVAKYLWRVIQSKKKQGVEAVTLLPIVEHKTKKENVKLFFELLVLSSSGLINVVQESAYGDVLLQETPQLEAISGADRL